MYKSPVFWLLLSLVLLALVTSLAPLEKTLGSNARLVYLHGAWVWVALCAFVAAAGSGLLGLVLRREKLHLWSRALGRTALLLWCLFLPMSMYLMQANWNGLFLSEPRWRIPFTFAVTAVLLQVGLSFMKPAWASAANLVFAAALINAMQGMENVLHPVSPIMSSDSRSIQLYFSALLVLGLLAAWQAASLWLRMEKPLVPA